MKRLLSLSVLLVVVAWSVEALTSGSSKVVARGKSFAVEEASPRKIFDRDPNDPQQEGNWHKGWREDHQPGVDALAKKIERVIAEHTKAHPLPLVAYDPKLPEVWSWSDPDDDHSYEQSLGHPVRYLVRFYDRKNPVDALDGIRLELAFSALPKKSQIEALILKIENAARRR